jgi:hypothetical protein
MHSMTLATIVEGDGEVSALPLRLRRLRPEWRIPRPVRGRRNALVMRDHPKNLEHYLPIARANIQDRGALLVVLDADDDCPAQLAPELLARSKQAIHDVPMRIVMAKRTFESWLIAGGAVEIDDTRRPDEIASPKAAIKSALGRYRETADMARLTARLDHVRAAGASPSFSKLLRDLEDIAKAGGGP